MSTVLIFYFIDRPEFRSQKFGCLTLIKNKKPPKALMGLFFLSNLPNISCGMLRDVLLYK